MTLFTEKHVSYCLDGSETLVDIVLDKGSVALVEADYCEDDDSFSRCWVTMKDGSDVLMDMTVRTFFDVIGQ